MSYDNLKNEFELRGSYDNEYCYFDYYNGTALKKSFPVDINKSPFILNITGVIENRNLLSIFPFYFLFTLSIFFCSCCFFFYFFYSFFKCIIYLLLLLH